MLRHVRRITLASSIDLITAHRLARHLPTFPASIPLTFPVPSFPGSVIAP
jgi:hypothetical protein